MIVFSLATLKALQIYGIAIAISMLVALLIKVMVLVTGRLNKPLAPANARPQSPTATDRTPPPPHRHAAVPDEVIAAISAALAVMTGPHRILHIAPSQVSWSLQGRSAQHSHQPQRK